MSYSSDPMSDTLIAKCTVGVDLDAAARAYAAHLRGEADSSIDYVSLLITAAVAYDDAARALEADETYGEKGRYEP